MAIIKDLYVKLEPGTKVRLRKYTKEDRPTRWLSEMLAECSGKIVTITKCDNRLASDSFYSCDGLNFEVEEYPWVFRYADIEEIITEEKKEPTTQELYDTFMQLVDEALAALKTNKPPKKEVKEVKRVAKEGEWIKVVNPLFSMGLYKAGDILKVVRKRGKWRDYSVYAETEKRYPELLRADDNPYGYANLIESEYVVLENYEPETK